ncbi:MAG: transcription elongation factor GreB [Pseudomonadales bacterium]|nr:transcription elongation factor GreB [Pseudomonadales bacterium]
MGRWRPPQKPGAKYITPEGWKKLDEELDLLWRVRRPDVTRHLSAAAAEGDRSENAEYIYRKKELGEIDRRVRFLRKRLEQVTVVDRLPDDKQRVFFGAWVTVEDDKGVEHRYRIVGPDEIDLSNGLISLDSPLARAMLKKTVDDEFAVNLPSGKAVYCITEVAYQTVQK